MELPENVSREDVASLMRDKYDGDKDADIADDLKRLAEGEPLAYVIGWMPFLGLKVRLDSRPLIPRPETEWWTALLIAHLREQFDNNDPFTFLDLCAGSGAIGLSILKEFPNAQVSFGELMPEHAASIKRSIRENALDAARAHIEATDLFVAFRNQRFDVIATNPPYIPESRPLPESVSTFEPKEALYAGSDGLSIIRQIALEATGHMHPGGELWMECDISNIEAAKEMLETYGAALAEIRTDQYGRPRLAVGYYA